MDRLASAFTDENDAAMKAIVDNVGAKLGGTLKDVSDSFMKAFVNIVGTKLKSIASKKVNPGMKAATTRLASTVTMTTDSDLKACVNE